MRSVKIGVLKNRLSTYLRYVRNGEEIIVQDRDQPVARIIPFRSPDISEEDAYLSSIGVLKLPERAMDWDAFCRLPMPAVSDDAAQEAIAWAKGDR